MQIAVDGILTNYEVFGAQKPKAIVILHGWGQNSENWKDVGVRLSENYKVILLDLPGFGSSSRPETNFSMQDYTDFTKHFIEKLNLDNIILIGHSFGGKIAIILASQFNKIFKLILVSPSGTETDSIWLKIKIFRAKIFKILFSWTPSYFKQKIFNLLASSDYKNAGNLRGTFKKVVSVKVLDYASQIKIPTIIAWGENDNKLPISDAVKLKHLIKGSILRVLWGAGHSPNIESSEKLANLFLEYL